MDRRSYHPMVEIKSNITINSDLKSDWGDCDSQVLEIVKWIIDNSGE